MSYLESRTIHCTGRHHALLTGPCIWVLTSYIHQGRQSLAHASSLLSPAVHYVGSELWRFVEMESGRVSTFSSFCAEHLVTPCVGYGSLHLYLRSTRSEERTSLVCYRSSPSSCKRRCRCQDGTVALGVVPAKQGLQRIPPDWVVQGGYDLLRPVLLRPSPT